MKKIFITITFLISLFSYVFAETKNDYIYKATTSGLSYKKSVLYADLKIKFDNKEILNKKESKKLAALESKIKQGEEKFLALKEKDPNKFFQKQEKIKKNTAIQNERSTARAVYEEYIYKNIKDDEVPINPKTGFPEILNKPFVTFDEGIAYGMITRLQKQDKYNRSDFVWQDQLVGLYFDVTSVNMKPINSMARLTVYYPWYHTFNGMQIFPAQTILYACDIFAGPVFHADMWKYIRLNFAGGLHYMYQLSDEYHLNYLGVGFLTGLELPLARRWTLIQNGTFSIDYANLGTNNRVQPFDYSWTYQLSFGVRYSRKNLNKYAYIHRINHDNYKEKILKAETAAAESAETEVNAKGE